MKDFNLQEDVDIKLFDNNQKKLGARKGSYIEKKVNIAAVVPLFHPVLSDVSNIIRYARFFDECIVVDDSGNNSVLFEQCTKSENSRITYLYNINEQGLSKTVNKGVEEAINRSASWIMIINQDSSIHTNIVAIFKEYILHNNTADIAELAPQYNYDRHPRKSKNGYKSITYADMTGSVINVNVWRKVGGYDTRFFIDGLDTEWCLRVRRKGYKIVQCSQAVMEHHPGETRELRIFGHAIFKYGWHVPVRYYYQFKAAFILHDEYHDIKTDLFALYKFLKVIFLFDNKAEYIKMIRQAKNDFLNNKFGKYKELD
ncbi:MAG: glycosyltransferase [Muribaculaceae bacterium]|nr:glycosyltransferase [Muribaculaceae bacterium]